MSLEVSEVKTVIDDFLNNLREHGLDADFDRNVRFMIYRAQKDESGFQFEDDHLGEIVLKKEEESEDTNWNITAKGLLLLMHHLMVVENIPRASQFMDEYYKLLATRNYGKTPAAIKQEVLKMNKRKVLHWLIQTYEKYVYNDSELIDIMNSLK